jgi:hypothetical protein
MEVVATDSDFGGDDNGERGSLVPGAVAGRSAPAGIRAGGGLLCAMVDRIHACAFTLAALGRGRRPDSQRLREERLAGGEARRTAAARKAEGDPLRHWRG